MSIPAKTLGRVVHFSAVGAGTVGSSVPLSGLSAEASAAIAEILVDLGEALGNLTWDGMSYQCSQFVVGSKKRVLTLTSSLREME